MQVVSPFALAVACLLISSCVPTSSRPDRKADVLVRPQNCVVAGIMAENANHDPVFAKPLGSSMSIEAGFLVHVGVDGFFKTSREVSTTFLESRRTAVLVGPGGEVASVHIGRIWTSLGKSECCTLKGASDLSWLYNYDVAAAHVILSSSDSSAPIVIPIVVYNCRE